MSRETNPATFVGPSAQSLSAPAALHGLLRCPCSAGLGQVWSAPWADGGHADPRSGGSDATISGRVRIIGHRRPSQGGLADIVTMKEASAGEYDRQMKENEIFMTTVKENMIPGMD